MAVFSLKPMLRHVSIRRWRLALAFVVTMLVGAAFIASHGTNVVMRNYCARCGLCKEVVIWIARPLDRRGLSSWRWQYTRNTSSPVFEFAGHRVADHEHDFHICQKFMSSANSRPGVFGEYRLAQTNTWFMDSVRVADLVQIKTQWPEFDDRLLYDVLQCDDFEIAAGRLALLGEFLMSDEQQPLESLRASWQAEESIVSPPPRRVQMTGYDAW